jgi:hypothetical protein
LEILFRSWTTPIAVLKREQAAKKIEGVNEKRINELLELERPLGHWWPSNQCQSFARQTLIEGGWTPPPPRPPGFSIGF